MIVLDRAGALLNQVLFGGLGVAMVGAAWWMWQSRLFSKALSSLGLIVGLTLILIQVTIAPATSGISKTLTMPSLLLFWIWMIWGGVVAWRRTPKMSLSRTPAPQ